MTSLRSILTESKYGKLQPETEKNTTKLVFIMMYNGQEYQYLLCNENLISVHSGASKKKIGLICTESSKAYEILGADDDIIDPANTAIISEMWKCITS